jgi:alpha-mannosidase
MTYSRTIFIAASHAIEDVPADLSSELALDYLTAWTSLWDPRLLVAAGSVPEWRRGDTSGLDLEDALLVCPEAALARIDQPLQERLRLGRNRLVPTARRSRNEVVRELLEAHQVRHAGSESPDRETIAGGDHPCSLLEDFYAFGYALLQIQCMARKLRYSFNLDWMKVGEQIVSAARAALQQDAGETDRWLSAAFDSLSQERDRYCSQQGNLLELLLVAPSTLGDSLGRSLDSPQPLTIYATTEVLRQWQSRNAGAWLKLRERLQADSACLAGGLRHELPHVWWPEGTLIRELAGARQDCIELGIEPPRVWMRFSMSIATSLAAIARQFGFQGAIIAPLAGGTIPKKDHAKIRWQGTGDRGGLDCILGHVLDAADGNAILNLGASMAQQLDYHQVPTLVLAHWPGKVSPGFEDLFRASSRTPALGKWTKADSYFASTAQPYWSDAFTSCDFHPPLPKSSSEIHALHLRIVQGLRQAYWLEHLASLARLWAWTPRLTPSVGDSRRDLDGCRMQCERLHQGLQKESSDLASVGIAADDLAAELAQELRARVPCSDEDLFFNPTSHPKRIFLADYPRIIDPSSCTRIVACESDLATSQCVVEIPPFGFVKTASQPPVGQGAREAASPVATSTASKASWVGRIFGSRSSVAQDDGSMANEVMEVQIDPEKGHLRSLYVVNKRGNRLSGQLSWVNNPLQLRNALQDSSFQGLGDVRMRVLHSSKVRGTIQVTGVLASGVCDIRYTLWHGAQWLDIEVQGDGVEVDAGFPAWRMVWPSEAASLAAWSQGARGKLPAPLQSAVELIEIDDAEHRIHFATGGLSIHRRVGPNALASAIPTDRTGVYRARFSIGLDWANPWAIAIDRMIPDLYCVSQGTGRTAKGYAPDPGAWLARCNVSNLHFRWIDPKPALGLTQPPEGEAEAIEDGIEADGSLWMVETAGKSGTAKLGCVRPIDRAWRVDFRSLEYDKLKVEEGEAWIPFQAWDRFRIAVCFKK